VGSDVEDLEEFSAGMSGITTVSRGLEVVGVQDLRLRQSSTSFGEKTRRLSAAVARDMSSMKQNVRSSECLSLEVDVG